MKKLIIVLLSCYMGVAYSLTDNWSKNLDSPPQDAINFYKLHEGYQGETGKYIYIKSPMKVNKFIITILKNMIFVKGGRFNVSNNKIEVESFYISNQLTSYWYYYSYLYAKSKYYPTKYDMTDTFKNGLYPIGVGFKTAKNYCQWLAKKTGLPFALPTMEQWLYAATSRGINWDYPTDNGKLEIGKNYPNILPRNSLTIVNLVNGLPVNSIGIHQFFGNGAQWTSTRLTNKSQAQFHVFVREHEDYGVNNIVAGTPYSWAKKYVEENKLLNGYYVNSLNPNLEMKTMGGAAFRCVINTDKPLPKV